MKSDILISFDFPAQHVKPPSVDANIQIKPDPESGKKGL